MSSGSLIQADQPTDRGNETILLLLRPELPLVLLDAESGASIEPKLQTDEHSRVDITIEPGGVLEDITGGLADESAAGRWLRFVGMGFGCMGVKRITAAWNSLSQVGLAV